MAKIENTKMTVSLDRESKRLIRNLAKAIDRLTRNIAPFEVKEGVRRLAEPVREDQGLMGFEEPVRYSGDSKVEATFHPYPDPAEPELRTPTIAKFRALG